MLASVEIGSCHTALSEYRAMNFLQQQSVCLSFLTKDRIGNLNQTLQREFNSSFFQSKPRIRCFT